MENKDSNSPNGQRSHRCVFEFLKSSCTTAHYLTIAFLWPTFQFLLVTLRDIPITTRVDYTWAHRYTYATALPQAPKILCQSSE